MNRLTDNMAKIQMAIESGATVRNEKGERITLPNTIDHRTEDCVKCSVGPNHYYWSTAGIQNELFVDGKPFDEWLDQQPINI